MEDETKIKEIPKKKSRKILIIGILIISLAVISISAGLYFIFWQKEEEETLPKEVQQEEKEIESKESMVEEDIVFKKETAEVPSWIKNDPNGDEGPWFSSLYMAESTDGLNFNNEKLFVDHAGVAHLMLTSDNQLIATFQYFSYTNEDLFDVIAYAISDDLGKTWSSIKPVVIEELGGNGATACDPTLVELDDGRLRLYFTHHEPGQEYPQLFSAVANSIDSAFESEGQQLSTDEIILDPAVVKFDGQWHHYTVKHGSSFELEPDVDQVSVHSISDDGLDFQLTDEINIGMQMLGDVIEDNGGLRFYNGSQSASSADGYNWTLDVGERVQGADPGVVKLPDGKYLIVHTKVGEMSN